MSNKESNSIDFKALGCKLREIRVAKGLTQEYIATMANVNISHVSNIENNRVKISLQTLILFCNALDVTLDFVLSKEYPRSATALDNEILKELYSCTPRTKEQILEIIKILK